MPRAAAPPSLVGLLRWPAWALAVLALGSAFAPLRPDFLRGIHLALCVMGVLEAGVSVGRGRRAAFFAYAAIAVLTNPFRPFVFETGTWRLIHAAIGLWLAADHLPRRE
ncbi:MAG TPA: DUF6804 family protein [Candidatus Eisenbacteria bacterium]